MNATRILRVAVLLASVAAIAAAGAAGVRAADPSTTPAPNTMGASVTASVVMSESPYVYVKNLGSVPTTFSTSAPDGWQVTPSEMTLQPNESARFEVAGSGDAGIMAVYGSSARGVAGDSTKMVFGKIALTQTRPFDMSRLIAPAFWAIVILAGIVIFMWRVKPWRIRLTRV